MEDKKREELNLPSYMQVKGVNKSSSALRAKIQAQKASGAAARQAGGPQPHAATKITLDEFAAPPSPARQRGKGQAGAPKGPVSPGQRKGLSDEMAQAPRRVAGGAARTSPPASQTGSRKTASSQRAEAGARNPKGPAGPVRKQAGRAGKARGNPSLDMTAAQIANQPHRAEARAKRKKMSGLKPGRLALVALILLGLVAGVWYALSGAKGDQEEGMFAVGATARFPEGVSVLGVDVGGKTKSAVRDAVQKAAEETLAKAKVSLQMGGETYAIAGSDLSLSYDIEDVLQRALAFEPPAEDAAVVDVTQGGAPGAFNNIFTYDQAALRRAVEDIAAKFDVEPVNAIGEPTMHEDHTVTFAYQNGQVGRAVDVEATIEKIEDMFGRGVYAAQLDGVYHDVQPAVTTAMLTESIGLRGSCTTRYATIGKTSEETPTIENRVFNIHKAADKINGCMVAPGEEWSFNGYVGERSAEEGWKQANGIADGREYTLQYGGGICQVSTTLYNALLQAGVTVTDRRAHSIPSDYVDHGLDATVDYAMDLDLKFINDTGAPLYLFVYYEDVEGRHLQEITFLVYGKPLENGVTYKLRSEEVEKKERTDVVYTDDNTIPRGYKLVTIKARPSYRAEVYLDKYVGEGLVSSEYLYTDSYAGNAEYAQRGTASPKYYEPPEGAVPIE